MEVTTAQSLSHAKLPKPSSFFTASPSPHPFFHCKVSFLASSSLPFQCSKNILTQLQGLRIRTKPLRTLGVIYAYKAETESPPTDVSEKWLLEPVGITNDFSAFVRPKRTHGSYGDIGVVSIKELLMLKMRCQVPFIGAKRKVGHGDGDTRHIGFKVPMPSAFEINSNEVTVGRLPEKADMVIPVATVSGVHARIQKKEGNLLVTDLDSTNGTFIDEIRLRPGVAATVSPGSCVIFGDEHLAVFRVSKLENVEAASSPDPSEDNVETDTPIENAKTG